MADVFISYKKEDRHLCERVVNAVRAEGWSVWWDDGLTPQRSWDREIQDQITASKAVIVVWTPRSVASDWVRSEADYAKEHGKLVPLEIEAFEVPLAFRLIQRARLAGWDGSSATPEWRKAVRWIAELVGHHPSVTAAIELSAPTSHQRKVESISRPHEAEICDQPYLPVLSVLSPGRFEMGSPPSQRGRFENEGATKQVEVKQSIAVGQAPVTRAQWRAFVDQSGYLARGRASSCWVWRDDVRRWCLEEGAGWLAPGFSQDDDHPVVGVSYEDARNYCVWASQSSGLNYRMPTNEEWEFACRAGSAYAYNVGASISISDANFDGRYLLGTGQRPANPIQLFRGGTTAIQRYRPNSFGLYDMHGNVWEWAHSSDGVDASLRGGSWVDHPRRLRSASRLTCNRKNRSNAIGFRVCRLA